MKTRMMALAVLFLLPVLPAAAAALNFHDLRSIEQACRNDIKSLCNNVARGGGRIAQCISANASSLSPGCGSVLKAEKAKLPAANPDYDTE